ncbi:hypothetical protein J4Q44_G00334790 [Coregonus suidteri]|uniref:Uncharacterized protein n=1 Tax=Coregonus suidteri TaxID=861788 RepID=A0AAN8KZT3_9TELE
MWQACDNGKLFLGRDLPPSVVWSCPVISWTLPSRLNTSAWTPITYNHTIPKSATCCCLSDYIITKHPDLSTHRPLALVSWGRTLELSQVTMPEVCDWLQLTAARGNRGDSLRQCCEESLSLLLDGRLEVTDWGRGRVHKSRAALRNEEKQSPRSTGLPWTEPSRTESRNMEPHSSLKHRAQLQ